MRKTLLFSVCSLILICLSHFLIDKVLAQEENSVIYEALVEEVSDSGQESLGAELVAFQKLKVKFLTGEKKERWQ